MKKIIFAAFAACLALFTSCDKSGVDHTGDATGKLYGTWVLDTKTVGNQTTDFSGDNFILYLFEPMLAFAQEGTLLTFDIDDVDAVTFSYNANQNQISFHQMLSLSKGFLVNQKTMTLYGTYDIPELTNEKLELTQVSNSVTTTYRYHKVSASASK